MPKNIGRSGSFAVMDGPVSLLARRKPGVNIDVPIRNFDVHGLNFVTHGVNIAVHGRDFDVHGLTFVIHTRELRSSRQELVKSHP